MCKKTPAPNAREGYCRGKGSLEFEFFVRSGFGFLRFGHHRGNDGFGPGHVLLDDEALRNKIGGPYPVVAANIVADVIIGLAPYAKTVVAPGGWFIVSGIIDDRAAETDEKLKQAGFEVAEVISSDCWYAMLCRNPL